MPGTVARRRQPRPAATYLAGMVPTDDAERRATPAADRSARATGDDAVRPGRGDGMPVTGPTSREAWIEAVRVRTLPAAVAPVVVGTAASATALAWSRGDGPPPSWLRFALAGAVALLLQVAVNFANDYFDGVAGVDTADRVGPLRGVGSGLVTPAAMKRAMVATLAAAAVVGLVLAALAGWELLVVGLASLVATLWYSGGDRPIASRGLGEVVVFLFFGLVATVGSAYVQDERLTWVPVVAAVPIGALAVALLVVNNLRDIPTDTVVGKRTLAVRMGDARTRVLYQALVVGSFVVVVVLAVALSSWWVLLALLAAPLAVPAVRVVREAPPGPPLVAALGRTARTQLVLAVLLAIGLLAGGWTS